MLAGFLHFPLILISKDYQEFEVVHLENINHGDLTQMVYRKLMQIDAEIFCRKNLKIIVELRIIKEGIFLFSFDDAVFEDREGEMPSAIYERNAFLVNLMNSFLFSLYYSDKQHQLYSQCYMTVDPHDMLIVTMIKGRMGYYLGQFNKLFSPRGIVEIPDASVPVTNHFTLDRYALPFESVKVATDAWAAAVEKDSLCVNIFSQLMRAAIFSTNHINLPSIVESWTVAERLLCRRWSKLIKSRHRQNDGQNEPLTNSGQKKTDANELKFPTASKMIKDLHSAGEIDDGLRNHLERINKIRNDVMHGNINYVSFFEVNEVFHATTRMIEIEFDFKIGQTGFAVWSH